MKKNIIILLIVISFTCQGCVYLAAGAVGYGVVKATKAITKRRPRLSDMQRRAIETKEVEGNKEDVLRSTVTVFLDRGYDVQNSDYVGGIITASNDKPSLQITAMIEEFTETRIRMRITMKDKDCVVEDETVFMELFDDIQTEVFRRVNTKN